VTLLLTAVALVAFASNSILCRLALGAREIDAASFTLVRLVSGAFMLLLIRAAVARRAAPKTLTTAKTVTASKAVTTAKTLTTAKTVTTATSGPWLPAALLFIYAAPFSFAYIRLSAGTGALILFTCVQATMLIGAIRSGERFQWLEGIGLAIALAGLAYLVSPGLSAPSPLGSALMATAGVSWGIYSLRGRSSADPLGDTTLNFVWAIPLALLVSLVAIRGSHVSDRGVALAMASGALASGLGYTVWFAALRGLTAIRAATVQLTVPVLAATGGVLFLQESVTVRLVVAAALILGGVGLALAGRAQGRISSSSA
jgi:drug/metabolite transporter (DMT)-like permease